MATVGMVADLVRQIGGDHVSVTQIIGSGIDPHLYKPTGFAVKQMMGADAVFYSGLHLEGKMTETLEKQLKSKPTFAIAERIDPSVLIEPEGRTGQHDPHVWMDVSAWSLCAEQVASALSELMPDRSAEIQENADAYLQQLKKLHEYGREVIDTVPDDQRTLVTSHDAFQYFGRAYGIDVESVQGLSTESEAGLQRINELVDLLVEKKVRAVFVESSIASRNIEALKEGAQSRGHTVKLGGELFSDAMGITGSYTGTYIGMLDHNLTLVARSLGGDAPERGFHGKLSWEDDAQ
ncbi:MAG: zinc ABC transporter substrate-binding protein [Planctomycetota bacterium]